MPDRVIHKLVIPLVMFCLLFTASACTLDDLFASLTPSEPTQAIVHTTFQLDPVFREFFRTLGGEAIIGPPISPAFTENEKTCQFTVGVKMCYDPRRKAAQQLFLEPLGLSFNLKEKPLDIADSTDPLYLDGYGIYPAFIPALQKLQLTRFAGRPISHMHREEDENSRIIQYFENAAFYIKLNDPEQTVHPVAYGYMACEVCKKTSIDIPIDAMPTFQPQIGQIFAPQISRVGVDLVGRPLSVYYQTEDGYYRQIYENVVAQSREVNQGAMSFLDLPRQVIDPDTQFAYFQPVAPINDPSLVFHEVKDGLGFNEVALFDAYVAQHGGRELSGEVISERFEVDGLYRQCYITYCLDYNPEDGSIQPAPLGKEWLVLNPPVKVAVDNLVLTPEKIHLRTWVKQDIISSVENQIVFMLVVQKDDQSPIPNLTSTLKLYLPDGSTREYRLPTTDEQGQANVELDPIEAPNGKIIPYTVCLDIDTNYVNCVKESFMIWGNP